uniref:Forkhead box O1 b n=1 Tax=Myripristis murdjan TaxID=586833 RepID=A0A667ZG04_9TELE
MRQLVEIDPDFQPLSRPRSCTWPLPRPEVLEPASSNTSSPAPYAEQKPPHQQQVPPPGVAPLGAAGQRKSSSSRRNAWGNMSYADLITKAIDSSPEKRLTLSQIYEWMVKSVPYFKDKGDSNSSAGWKNSIRHNLSLHSRFVRMQNEGTGKSSWWMLNPEGGKNGKSPRRRAASMDNNSKFAKSRGRATKKKVQCPFINTILTSSHWGSKVGLQEGAEGGAGSPGSQYSNWLGSPNSHSNDDFEAWNTFRTRASSDASTLSGRHSPFISEQDDLGESDVHMVYPGGAGTKIAATLPSLSELTGSMGQHGSENVMESLLDNLNLLSPKNPQMSSDASHSSNSAMLQNSPYNSAGMAPQPQQDYHKCLYGQVRMNSLSPVPLQTIPDAKSGFGAFENHYNCPPGLLKELLTADADPNRDMMPPREAVVSQAGRGGCLLPSYNSQGQVGGHDRVKIMNPPQTHPVPQVHPQAIHSQAPSASRDMNSWRPPQMTSLRTCMQLPHSHSVHANGVPTGYGGTNGYSEPGSAHPHTHHQERLPSDLDNMSIERFECDMESVLHDTLMDGGALDFNFDPTAGPQGIPQRVKTTTHSWVSG